MNNSVCLRVACLLLLSCSPVLGAAADGPASPQYTNLRKMPDALTLATLSNGLTVIVQENHVARAKAGKISPEEFRTAVQMVIALHAQENTSIAGQARQAALDELFGLGHNYDKTFDARIEAVRLQDVVGAARKYLNNYLLVTTSPQEQLNAASGRNETAGKPAR